MHHLHMSTGFTFVVALFVVSLIAVVFAFVRSMRNDRLEAEAAIADAKAREAAFTNRTYTPDELQRMHGVRVEARQAQNYQGLAQANALPAGAWGSSGGYVPVAAATPVYHSDPLTGLATGILLGSALGHSHGGSTTIINEAPSSHSHSYSDSGSSSYSSSSSSDSGFSYSDSSSSSSYDSGSSGGFDASW